LRGTVSLADFSADRLNDPATHALATKITVIDDGSPDPAAFCPQIAIATLNDGSTRTTRVDALFGSPADPLTNEQHLAKFRACLAFGFGREMPALADEMIARVGALETEPDVGALARRLAKP
jgi:2-methylcitrate dehydratase PrpD